MTKIFVAIIAYPLVDRQTKYFLEFLSFFIFFLSLVLIGQFILELCFLFSFSNAKEGWGGEGVDRRLKLYLGVTILTPYPLGT